MIPIIAMVSSTREDGQYKISQEYINAVLSSGGAPFMLPPCTDEEKLDALLKNADGLVLTGGCDMEPARYGQKTQPWCGRIDTQRDEEEYILLEKAFKRRMPVLGICRGFQTINCFLGGTLYQDIAAEKGVQIKHDQHDRRAEKVHEAALLEGTLLRRIIGKDVIGVNSRHHQGILELAKDLIPSAVAPDGLIEGFEIPEQGLLAVQWHPESMAAAEPEARAIFKEWIGLAAAEGARA